MNGDQVEGYNQSVLFKIRADLREVTSSCKFRDVDKEGRKGRRERQTERKSEMERDERRGEKSKP